MKVNLKKDIKINSVLEKVEFFKQFNLNETINFNKYICKKEFFENRCIIVKHRLIISKVEPTIPSLKIEFVKLIDTIEGTSLEGQHLSGKKLILLGKISFNLMVRYHYNKGKIKCSIKNIILPFSTFIIIPKDICRADRVNLRYEIEDFSIVHLCENKVLISVTPIIQYVDEYLADKD